MEMIIFGIFMILSFITGYTLASGKQKNEKVNIKPLKIVKKIVNNHKDEYQEDEATKIMLENINNYDGSGYNQKDIPIESGGDEEWI